jgi:hypothetical protein
MRFAKNKWTQLLPRMGRQAVQETVEAAGYSETSAAFHKTARKIAESAALYIHRSNSPSSLRGFSPRANYTDERPPLVGEVSANFWE